MVNTKSMFHILNLKRINTVLKVGQHFKPKSATTVKTKAPSPKDLNCNQ